MLDWIDPTVEDHRSECLVGEKEREGEKEERQRWTRTTDDQMIEALLREIFQLLQHGGNESVGQHRKKD